jgi:hypothetical protein
VLLPELAACRGVAQSPPHDRDVLGHSLAALDAVVGLQSLVRGRRVPSLPEVWRAELSPFGDRLTGWLGRDVPGLGQPRGVWLRVAALLHDVGKPGTARFDPSRERWRFLGHDAAGARLVGGVAERLRLSQRAGRYLAELVAHHLRPMALSRAGGPSRRAVYRYFRATGDEGVDVALLSLADQAGKALIPAAEAEAIGRTAATLLRAWFDGPAELVRPEPLIRGDVLAAELGREPGPWLGPLLESLAEAQASGRVTDRSAALAHARRWLRQRDKREPRPSADL